MKILDERRSSRDPEIIYRIIETDTGQVICNCPACEHGGECWPMKKVRTQREYHAQLAVKLQISNRLPDFKRQQKEQWDYITNRQEKAKAALESREKILSLRSLFKRVSVPIPVSSESTPTRQTESLPRIARTRLSRSLD